MQVTPISNDPAELDFELLFRDAPPAYHPEPYWEPRIYDMLYEPRDSAHDDGIVTALLAQSDHSSPAQLAGCCQCQKTGCLKMYCRCFRNGQQCGEWCSCADCHNHQWDERWGAASNRRPAAEEHFRGCNCKRSKCNKNYCECLIRGLMCLDSCRCLKCRNGKV